MQAKPTISCYNTGVFSHGKNTTRAVCVPRKVHQDVPAALGLQCQGLQLEPGAAARHSPCRAAACMDTQNGPQSRPGPAQAERGWGGGAGFVGVRCLQDLEPQSSSSFAFLRLLDPAGYTFPLTNTITIKLLFIHIWVTGLNGWGARGKAKIKPHTYASSFQGLHSQGLHFL